MHGVLGNKIQWPIEATFTIHVLSIFPFQYDMHLAGIVSVHFLIFGRVEAAKTHRFHHFLFVGRFTF